MKDIGDLEEIQRASSYLGRMNLVLVKIRKVGQTSLWRIYKKLKIYKDIIRSSILFSG